ncbi:hypothetical protein RF11_11119 [Thelohanellus kitauei]|uniref:Uncharacterized protein n=1 Tax=Thelohanellus kitauei TaxID=669202 RepID=A0A0C2JJA1_THEKT|nr:hypothetical protein RF11_11119 [Thelohanellus kitauei]
MFCIDPEISQLGQNHLVTIQPLLFKYLFVSYLGIVSGYHGRLSFNSPQKSSQQGSVQTCTGALLRELYVDRDCDVTHVRQSLARGSAGLTSAKNLPPSSFDESYDIKATFVRWESQMSVNYEKHFFSQRTLC